MLAAMDRNKSLTEVQAWELEEELERSHKDRYDQDCRLYLLRHFQVFLFTFQMSSIHDHTLSDFR